MPTLLVHRKMHPALAARVEASVSGGRPARGRPRPAVTALLRILFFVAMALFVWSVATTTRRFPQGNGGGAKPAAPLPPAAN